jgi:ATP-dependent helicase HrpB
MREPLPIDDVLPALLDALRAHGATVLVAPPGAGKTTRVPPAILDAGLAGDGRVVMLQPRRVAARAAAQRIAAERGTPVGAEVGYKIRFEDRTSEKTRLEILTEGLLTRRLQSDPFLEGVGCVVLDEFHERSLHADLALALLREVRRDARPDLRLVVMSATLDAAPVAAFLGDCPVVESKGRTFPVEVEYAERPDDGPLAPRCAAAVRRALRQEGDVLVFLPGVGDIERARDLLDDLGPSVAVLPLHGRLSDADQDRALAPSPLRKVVLATNVAETSLTIEGIRTVVDSGMANVPRFDPRLGLERLERVRISRASADQRAGRAGRTGPGRCVRLWTAAEHRGLLDADVPEIRRADLARTVLEIRGWGADPRAFGWFEAPGAAMVERAEALLRRLGALGASGVTAVGHALLALPIDPRPARVVVAGHAAGCLTAAATVAALATERDVLREVPDHADRSDLGLRLEVLREVERSAAAQRRWNADGRAVRQVARVRDQLVAAARRALGPPRRDERDPPEEALVRALLTGFPDRVARRRAPRSDRFRLADGGGAVLDPKSVVRDEALILAVGLEAGQRGERAEHRVRVACAVDPAWLPREAMEEAVETRFDAEREAVVQRRVTRFLDLTLAERPADEDGDAVTAALVAAARRDPRRALAPDAEVDAFVARLRCLAGWMPELELPTFPDLEPSEDGETTPLWEMLCGGRRSFADLRRAPLLDLLKVAAGRRAVDAVERLAPTRLALPHGPPGHLVYAPGEPPVLEARVQQLWGLRETPRIAGGRVPVMLHILAPSRRPVQITSDLASFWANTYAEVRKQLRGRYPKHDWPEDPLNFTPSPRAARR